MDFQTKSSRYVFEEPINSGFEELYPHNVLFYHIPPSEEITLNEFQEVAIERLKVLRICENASIKCIRSGNREWKEMIVNELNTEGLKCYTKLLLKGDAKKRSVFEARRRDYISHFILRLVYCDSDDLQRWFIKREVELFKLKFMDSSTSDIKQFLKLNNLEYFPISEDEKNDVKSGLIDSTLGYDATKIEMTDFYKVPFSDVSNLIKYRKCFIKSGLAYVCTQLFTSFLSTKHMEIIEKGLHMAKDLIIHLEDDERFIMLKKNLHKSYTRKDYSVASATVKIEDLDQLSKKSFPICMRHIHDTLVSQHHLRHQGRLQYGLYLKGIGVSLEDSLRFWHSNFSKIMDDSRFYQSYAYNIRYNYGKEGKQINYSPFSCLKIINTTVGPSEVHGCPFKSINSMAMKAKLTSYGIGIGNINEILNFSTKGHYQLACGKYFDISHDVESEVGISHPVQYFNMSQVIIDKRTSKEVHEQTENHSQSDTICSNEMSLDLCETSSD